MTLNYKIKAQVLLADIRGEQLTILFSDSFMHKIFTTKHVYPRTFYLPWNLEKDMKGEAPQIEVSPTGNFIFAANKDIICIYKKDWKQPIYRLEKKDCNRDQTFAQFISDEMVVFTACKSAIGFDLVSEKVVFNKTSDGLFATSIQEEPLVYKDKQILLDDQVISTFEDVRSTQAHLSPDKKKLLLIDEKRLMMQIVYLKNLRKLKERIYTVSIRS